MEECYAETIQEPMSNMTKDLVRNTRRSTKHAGSEKNYDCTEIPISSTMSTLSLSMSPSYNNEIEELEGMMSSTAENVLYEDENENESVVEDCENDEYQSKWLTTSSDDSNFWTEEMELLLTLKIANPVYDLETPDSLSENLYL
mmetsp:Transcript_13130/g.15434  ORF Transcript_13130/g.15434 Transcript_13130/m.15434 type:complete len:144 (-) Transcript_13130:308-739(-)|eukprot:CAMPEP_0198262002 /NCGR_PEP_ID=MMETSP1447-20131203/10580_1 /TAXON_ID=420782 /ORGANISM="Chaetoceros dichaeta, Strain CCMP1751" /LENGTH=143 /DNA_ID=CAMNT_0043950071 /DNA_START=144 /DNA_END=575 /DNA_ORIENTATION=+